MSFFGGSSKIDLLTGPQKQALNSMANLLNANIGVGGPVYGGPTVAGPSYLQQLAFQGGGDLLNRMPDTSGAISGLLAGPNPEAVGQYYQQAVFDPAMRGFQDTLSQVGTRFGETYGQSGGLGRALGQASTDFNTNMMAQLAGLQENERLSAFDRNLAGVGAAAQDQGNMLATLGGLSQLGAGQRGIETQQNLDQLSRWQQAQPWNNPWLQALTGPVMNTQAYAIGQDPGMASGIGSMLGGLGSMALGGYGLSLMG